MSALVKKVNCITEILRPIIWDVTKGEIVAVCDNYTMYKLSERVISQTGRQTMVYFIPSI